MYCLDTNIIIDIFRGDEKIIKKVEKIWDEGVFVTSITVCELYKGAYGHLNFEEKIKIVDDFLENTRIISEDFHSCKKFGEMWQHLKKRGNQIGDFDLIIGSIIEVNNLTLITRDRHFKKLGINVILI
jgi:predicted nucleic acid-binding protein